MGKDSKARDELGLFLFESRPQLLAIHDHWRLHQWRELEQRAESFRSACQAAGASPLVEICLDIRRAAAQAPEELGPLIEDLFHHFALLESGLRFEAAA